MFHSVCPAYSGFFFTRTTICAVQLIYSQCEVSDLLTNLGVASVTSGSNFLEQKLEHDTWPALTEHIRCLYPCVGMMMGWHWGDKLQCYWRLKWCVAELCFGSLYLLTMSVCLPLQKLNISVTVTYEPILSPAGLYEKLKFLSQEVNSDKSLTSQWVNCCVSDLLLTSLFWNLVLHLVLANFLWSPGLIIELKTYRKSSNVYVQNLTYREPVFDMQSKIYEKKKLE